MRLQQGFRKVTNNTYDLTISIQFLQYSTISKFRSVSGQSVKSTSSGLTSRGGLARASSKLDEGLVLGFSPVDIFFTNKLVDGVSLCRTVVNEFPVEVDHTQEGHGLFLRGRFREFRP